MPDHPQHGTAFAAAHPAAAAGRSFAPDLGASGEGGARLSALPAPVFPAPVFSAPVFPALEHATPAQVAAHVAGGPHESAGERLARLLAVLTDADGLAMVFQPIFDRALRPVGYEALSRFPSMPRRSPALWFAEAEDFGLRAELELAAIARAIDALGELPPDAFLSVNLSPATVLEPTLAPLLRRAPLHRLVVEITEELPIDDYALVRTALEPLRAAGLRIAIDDVGAGYASLKHILKLRPELVKFDACLTRDVDTDPMLSALVRALVGFSRETGSSVVAEGIETAAELAALHRIGVEFAQGFHLGRPAPLGPAHH